MGLFRSLLIGGLFTCCLQPETGSAERSASVKLGLVAPLTGDFGSYGGFMRNGAELAKADLAREGIEAVLVYEDACLPAAAVTAAKKLTEIDRVDGVAGSYCVIGMNAMAPIFKRAGTVAFHTSPIPAAMLADNPLLYTTNVRIEDEGRRVGEYAAQTLGLRRAATIYFDSQWGQAFVDSFAQAFIAGGGKIVATEVYPLDTPDLRPILSRVRSTGVDLVFFADVANRAGTVMKQARALGIEAKFLSVDEVEEPGVLETAGPAAEGLEYFAPEAVEITPAVAEFRSRFLAAYGFEPPSLSTNTYDATMILGRAASVCKRKSDCIREKLGGTRDYPGISGVFSIDAAGGTVKGFVRKTVRNRAFVRAE